MKKIALLIIVLTLGLTLTSAKPEMNIKGETQTPQQSLDSMAKAIRCVDLDYLMEGNRKFVTGDSISYSRKKIISGMGHGKSVRAVILTCSDARLTPEFIFETQPGELYVVQNPGGILDTTSIAALEYATTNLGAELVIVLGHTKCFELKTALKNELISDYYDHVIEVLQPIMDRVRDDRIPYKQEWDSMQVRQVVYNTNYLIQNSLVLHDRVSMNRLTIVGAFLDVETGKVSILDIKSVKIDPSLKIYK